MQIYTTILSTVCFILSLFTVHLFFAKKKQQNLNKLLSIILFARCGQIFVFLLITHNYLSIFPFFYLAFNPFYFAAPVCFYLYIRGLLNNETGLKKQDWLHFIPCGIIILHVLSSLFIKDINWISVSHEITKNKQLFISQKTGFLPPVFSSMGLRLLFIIYLIASWHIVIKAKLFSKKEWTSKKTWILLCLLGATSFKSIDIIPLFQNFNQSLDSTTWYVIFNSVALTFIITFILHKPYLLYNFLFVGTKLDKQATQIQLETELDNNPFNDKSIEAIEKDTEEMINSPQKSKLSEEQISTFKEKMEAYMIQEKPFLAQDFQIIHLAKMMDIPIHYCSYIINHSIGKNFRDWINSYRINHFIALYPLKNQKMTIQAIASDSGFKSLGTFYNAFKKETGLMPTSYFSNN